MATCFFIGHRDAKGSLLPALIAEVERHILEHGMTELVLGRYGRFDGSAAQSVKQVKERQTFFIAEDLRAEYCFPRCRGSYNSKMTRKRVRERNRGKK